MESESKSVITERLAAAAAALRDAALPLLRETTDALGWNSPSREESREGAVSSYFAMALHQYGGGLAMLTVRATNQSQPVLDLRVTCEFADEDIFNAERIVRAEDVAAAEVRDWLRKQLAGSLAAMQGRIRAR